MNYQTYVSRSLDGGETWALKNAINQEQTASPTTSFIRVGKTRAGLVGIGARMYRDNPDEGLVNRDNLGYVPVDLIMVRSTDAGRSWTPPRMLEPPLVGPAFEVSHPVFELENGAWLAPVATWRGWDGSLPNGDKGLKIDG